MFAKSLAHLAGCMLIFAPLTACENYRWTLNEQPIYSPPVLYAGYDIGDPHLKSCVQQTIKDQKITDPLQLEQLNCSHNNIRDISGLENFQQLRKLNLANNRLIHLQGLEILDQLEYLDIRQNSELDCQQLLKLNDKYSGQLLTDCEAPALSPEAS